MEALLEVALGEVGVAEEAGAPDNERILSYAEETAVPDTAADETPWCSIFLNWVAKEAGYEATGKRNARSWLRVGRPAEDPVPGDVVVFWRESPESWKGHVGIYVGHSKDAEEVFCLGGNQDDRVDVTAYDADRVLGFRRLRRVDPDLPEPVLERGERGPEVQKLQSLLNQTGFNAGPVDGIFGLKTERGVILLQSTDTAVENSGVYARETRGLLESVLDS